MSVRQPHPNMTPNLFFQIQVQVTFEAEFFSLFFKIHALWRSSNILFIYLLSLLISKEASLLLLMLMSAVALQEYEWSGNEGGKGDRTDEESNGLDENRRCYEKVKYREGNDWREGRPHMLLVCDLLTPFSHTSLT